MIEYSPKTKTVIVSGPGVTLDELIAFMKTIKDSPLEPK